MPITSFTGSYHFLSNFAEVRVNLDGLLYPTLEHAYQAAKTLNMYQRHEIWACNTPGQAKRLGRMVTLRPDWESVKVDIMRDLLWQKFAHDPFRQLLIATDPQELIELNTWGDKVWGMVQINNEWVGQNLLGKLLMQVRDELMGLS